MSDPYDRTKVPAAPTPVSLKFSPLRPLRRALWSAVDGDIWGLRDDHPGKIIGNILAVIVPLAASCTGLLYEALKSPWAFAGIFAGWLPYVARAWLRAAMHLDDPDAREVWARRLGQ